MADAFDQKLYSPETLKALLTPEMLQLATATGALVHAADTVDGGNYTLTLDIHRHANGVDISNVVLVKKDPVP